MCITWGWTNSSQLAQNHWVHLRRFKDPYRGMWNFGVSIYVVQWQPQSHWDEFEYSLTPTEDSLAKLFVLTKSVRSPFVRLDKLCHRAQLWIKFRKSLFVKHLSLSLENYLPSHAVHSHSLIFKRASMLDTYLIRKDPPSATFTWQALYTQRIWNMNYESSMLIPTNTFIYK